jgi:hypothetical protein
MQVSVWSVALIVASVVVAIGLVFANRGFAEGNQPLSPAAIALQSLEEAYRQKDIEAAILLKDFETEAKLMSSDLDSNDKEILASITEILELSFRKDIQDNGFPNFANMVCKVVKEIPAGDNVHLTEECTYPDGRTNSQVLIASNREGKWRIVGLLQ